LQTCDNDFITGYIAGRRAGKLPIPPQMLQRAQECRAISSSALTTKDSFKAINPEAAQNCDKARENVMKAIDGVETSTSGSTVDAIQLQKVQQANQWMAEQCKNL
jgi:hypothetical protein